MIFYSSNPRLKQIQVTSLTNASNKIQLIKILRQKFSFFLAKENLFKQIKEAEVAVKQEKILKSRQICKEVSFGTSTLCLFIIKVIFWSW